MGQIPLLKNKNKWLFCSEKPVAPSGLPLSGARALGLAHPLLQPWLPDPPPSLSLPQPSRPLWGQDPTIPHPTCPPRAYVLSEELHVWTQSLRVSVFHEPDHILHSPGGRVPAPWLPGIRPVGGRARGWMGGQRRDETRGRGSPCLPGRPARAPHPIPA